ncbi:MAG: ATP-binding cassette domain-containing protein [Paracoccus sp. (in: a-proteobacteria)]|nr:ATP-binding cassette domain-containing protein [Paracoccus sp. (in: a-proteobacteria)]
MVERARQNAPDAIRADGVSVAYRGGTAALRDASFTVPQGSITALVGGNGAGKSTLFKALMGLVPLAAGRIELGGMAAADALRARSLAYVPQTEDVDWTFPVLVEDVVMMGRFGHMGLLRRPRARDRDAVTEALRRVGMERFRLRQIGALSGGQKKRVFLARALVQEAPILLLDEPFTGVDVQTEAAIIALLREIREEGRAVLVSTHDLGSVPEYCDRVVLLRGTVLAYGPTAEIFTPANLRATFGAVLRQFALHGDALHQDEDSRALHVFSDDERPLVFYDDQHRVAGEGAAAQTGPRDPGAPAGETKPGSGRAP